MDETFEREKHENIKRMGEKTALCELALKFMRETCVYQYTYNFCWMGLPIIQFPQDLLALQEIIWDIKPDLIIEMGIARGGSLAFYASMLELLGGEGQVLGVDIDIRPHNRSAIESHPMRGRISMIEGSSGDEKVAKQVYHAARGRERVMVSLDSNHTHEHVLRELELYSPLVKRDSYLVVFDTTIEDQPEDFQHSGPWGKQNNPKTAVREFLKKNDRFEVDRQIEDKLLITVSREGFLKCVRDA
jgi:cephalosporin hydroxylase